MTHTSSTAAELAERLALERRGTAFLIFRDDTLSQRLVALEGAATVLSIGRDDASDVCLRWDTRVSRLHARLERIGQHWTLEDAGLSRNGTFVNGERLRGRHRLGEGDVLRFGSTTAVFRDPSAVEQGATRGSEGEPDDPRLSPAQRRVLVALCRPYREASPFVTPASNQRIAEELALSQDAVKSHLRALFAKFAVESLPQNEKRVRLAERALRTGAVSVDEL
jgi:pSer/pThr/pTyr-binding forkhead associated (FHA) protein